MWSVWLILSGIFLIIEIFTISFIFLWPAIGAVFALIAVSVGLGLNFQIAIFAISTIILILFTKPLTKKLFKTNENIPMNNKAIIGKTGIVLKPISIEKDGQIKAAGEIWSASTLEDEIFEVGDTVMVHDISSVRLIVKKKQ